MNRYIEKNDNNGIIDLFHEQQESKMSSNTKILFDTVDKIDNQTHKINDKSISEENGIPIFAWDGMKAIDRTQIEIESDSVYIQAQKDNKLMELVATDPWMPRISEDLFEKEVNGKPIPQDAIDKMTIRRSLRTEYEALKNEK